MQFRTPVLIQLNVDAWKASLSDYWDKPSLLLVQYGFPLDFNRNSPLYSDKRSHVSVVEFPQDVMSNVEEERKYNAIFYLE